MTSLQPCSIGHEAEANRNSALKGWRVIPARHTLGTGNQAALAPYTQRVKSTPVWLGPHARLFNNVVLMCFPPSRTQSGIPLTQDPEALHHIKGRPCTAR